jgi:DNA polymerase-4
VSRALRRKELAGRTVTLKLRWESFDTLTRQTTLLDPVTTTEVLWPIALELFRAADEATRRVRLIGIGVSGFEEPDAGQLSLFEAEAPRVDKRVASALDRITERFGSRAVTRAALLGDERPPGSPTEATE